MPENDHGVVFNSPNYKPEDVSDQPEHLTRKWTHGHSPTESTVSGARRLPSLASQGMRHRTSDGSQYRPTSISESLPSQEGIDIAEMGSDISSQTQRPRESVDTQHALQNFAPIAAEHPRKKEERKARIEKHQPIDERLKSRLDRLKSGQKRSWLASVLPRPSINPWDDEFDELKRLAKSHFPCRSAVKVFITDFKEHSAHSWECTLSEITKHMATKPSDVQVRWIHAPLGLGPLHSTIEDLFLHQGVAGRPFKNLGRSGWPYAKIEVLNFCDRGRFQDMRDVYRFLHNNAKLTEELNRECWEGFEPSWRTEGNGVLDDLRWRTTHLALSDDMATLPDYWTVSNSDVPWQMTEGLLAADSGPLEGLCPTLWQSDRQALHKHRFFGSAQLVRDLFRCFHRGDGFLLTMSPMRGINYIDKDFKTYLKEPGDAIFENDVASAIAFVRRQFQHSGTQNWHRASVEWLIVHLVTEIGISPHAVRQGFNAPRLEGAYQEVLQQFKRRRDEHFNSKYPDEPAELIKDMLVCKDELHRMTIMSKALERVFEALEQDVTDFEAEDLGKGMKPNNEKGMTAAEKTQDAIRRTHSVTEAYERLFETICMSLGEVYDLRSIQQRQSGLITDGQNRALFLVALVQLVFVPFATLCSYWGMNMSDIRATQMNQHDFWRMYASAVVALAILTVVAVLSRLAWQAKHSLTGLPRKPDDFVAGPANDKLDFDAV